MQRAKEAANERLFARQMQQKVAHWEQYCRIEEKAHLEAAKRVKQLTDELENKHRSMVQEQHRWTEVGEPITTVAHSPQRHSHWQVGLQLTVVLLVR